MRLSHANLFFLAISTSAAYGEFIAKDSPKAATPSTWKVGDDLEDVGQVTSIEKQKDGKFLVKANREGYKTEFTISEGKRK